VYHVALLRRSIHVRYSPSAAAASFCMRCFLEDVAVLDVAVAEACMRQLRLSY
jgi:hypothetical protein